MTESGDGSIDLVLEAKRTRRNVREFTDRKVTLDDLKTIIEAATWAPNHRHTEPWRFIVLEKDGDVRKQVAQIVHDWTYENIKNPNQKRRIDSSEGAKREILDAPAFIYVFARAGPNEEVTKENYAATACAVQNLLLAAHSLGIGVGWSTGKPCLAGVETVIGAEPDWQTVAALYIGYPSEKPEASRAPVDEVTTWL